MKDAACLSDVDCEGLKSRSGCRCNIQANINRPTRQQDDANLWTGERGRVGQRRRNSIGDNGGDNCCNVHPAHETIDTIQGNSRIPESAHWDVQERRLRNDWGESIDALTSRVGNGVATVCQNIQTWRNRKIAKPATCHLVRYCEEKTITTDSYASA